MANGVFNVSKGRGWELADRVELGDPAASRLQVRILKAAETDLTLETYDTFSALLVPAGNTEADFTNYNSGKTIAAADITMSDHSGTTNHFTIADQTWTAAGGATNNTTAKLIVCYDPLGTNVDANLVPISHHDFVATTDGNDLIADFGAKVFEAS